MSTFKKELFINIFGIILVVGLTVFFGLQYQKNRVQNNNSLSLKPTPAQNAIQTTIVLSLAEVQQHNSAGDCWVILGNNVYDATSYISQHPGGAGRISSLCGKDMTQAFAGQPHSSVADQLHADMLLGPLGKSVELQKAQVPAQSPTRIPTNYPSSALVTLTLVEVQKHNSANDCWTIINNNVYNVTSYINSHPGGAGKISSFCGKDMTQAFAGQPHSSAASQLHSSMLLGPLNSQVGTQQIQSQPTISVQSGSNASGEEGEDDD